LEGMERERAVTVAILGVDLGNSLCSVVGPDESGAVRLRRRRRRKTLIRSVEDLPTCLVAMESCCGGHHVGRILVGQGHAVRPMPPEHVQPHVKAQKNDDRDAEAIAEAAICPTLRFRALKRAEQHDLKATRRVRQRLVGARGRRGAPPALDPGRGRSGRDRADRRGRDGADFRGGRALAAWLGRVPRRHGTGGRTRLPGIGKRRNKPLGMSFIHGARAASPFLAKGETPIGAWLRGRLARGHRNVAVVALANRRARIARAMRRGDATFGARHAVRPAAQRGLQEGAGDGLTGDRRPGSLVRKTAHRRRVLHEDRTARSAIPVTAIHRESGRVCADVSEASLEPSCKRGGP